MSFTSSAPAKIILFGEHAVVYDKPAIAVPVSSLRATASAEESNIFQIIAKDLDRVFPIDIRSQVVDDALALTVYLVLQHLKLAPPPVSITIQSQIPLASGLGSGAAVSTALARALGKVLGHELSDFELNQIVYEVEKIHHGTPSGIDNTVIVYEKPIYFIRSKPIEIIDIAKAFPLVIADTGQQASTRISVGDVRKLYENTPNEIQLILDEIGQIVEQAREVIETGALERLGPLMLRNHACLQQLTVSSSQLDHLVQVAIDAGALGAKLSGGGRGGNMIALATFDTINAIEDALHHAGAVRVFTTVVDKQQVG